MEKILKAHVCRNSGDIVPRLHNLARLAELSGIAFRQEHADFLAEMNPLNIEGRYPEIWGPVPSRRGPVKAMVNLAFTAGTNTV